MSITALLIDLDGVLYEGERPVPGAAEAVGWIQERGIPHLFLTNTTSRPRPALVEKLAAMGVVTDEAHLFTPPVAARQWLEAHQALPAALFVPPATAAEFDGLPLAGESAEEAGAVVVGDLGEGWRFERLNRAFRLLMAGPDTPLVALGLTRYWRAPDGLRLDVGPFVKALEYATDRRAQVLGKPDRAFFQAALARLGSRPEETAMVGDDIRGDIQGAQEAGIAGVLVRTGKFLPRDLTLGIHPLAVLDSVAELPRRWPFEAPSSFRKR